MARDPTGKKSVSVKGNGNAVFKILQITMKISSNNEKIYSIKDFYAKLKYLLIMLIRT